MTSLSAIAGVPVLIAALVVGADAFAADRYAPVIVLKPHERASFDAARAALEKPVNGDFHDVTIAACVARLSRESGCSLVIDEKALADAAIGLDTVVQASLGKTALRTAIEQTLGPHGLAWVIRPPGLLITTQEQAYTDSELHVTVYYPVGDLAAGRPEYYDDLIDTITANIHPESWGEGNNNVPRVHAVLDQQAIAAKLRWDVHEGIEGLLVALRQLRSQSQPRPALILSKCQRDTFDLGRAALDRPVRADFFEVSRADCVARLAKEARCPIVIDEHSLADAAIELDEPVNMLLGETTLRTAIDRALGPAGIAWAIHPPALVITTQEQLNTNPKYQIAAFYPVGDLTLPYPARRSQPPGRFPRDSTSPHLAHDYDTLIDLIHADCQPISWLGRNGGASWIGPWNEPGVLSTVPLPWQDHEDIQAVLASLRTLQRQTMSETPAKDPPVPVMRCRPQLWRRGGR